jgi:hypothetical protein
MTDKNRHPGNTESSQFARWRWAIKKKVQNLKFVIMVSKKHWYINFLETWQENRENIKESPTNSLLNITRMMETLRL